MDDLQADEQARKDEIKAYKKLKKIADSDEFNDFFDIQIKLVADKLIWAMTSDSIKTWDDFCRVRGEIIARLQPIQEVCGADRQLQALQTQLDNYYKKQV